MEISLDQLQWFRFCRSGLMRPFTSVEECAAALFGIQAQILPAAAVALWNRTTGLDHAGFEDLLYERRSLVKLWGQRGTLHLYPSYDWPLVYAAMKRFRNWREERYDKSGGDVTEFRKLKKRINALAKKNGTVGRSDVRNAYEVQDDNILSSWGGIFADLVYEGHLCHIRKVGSEGRFAHRTHWLPDLEWKPPSRRSVATEIIKRYFHSYGPAGAHDFAYWRGGRVSDATKLIANLGADFINVQHNGDDMWALAADIDQLTETPPPRAEWPTLMLYRFDPLLLAHKDKSLFIDMRFYKRIWQAAGHIEGTIIVRGKIIASWRYSKKGKTLIIEVFPFGKFGKRVIKETTQRSEMLAAFFGLEFGGVQICDQ